MFKEENLTKNNEVKNNNFEILKQNFSHCFDKNGDFDFDKFKKEISENEIDFSKESYGMDWLGKSYARVLASEPARTLLKEDKNWNKKEENKNSENVLVKWDNLEVLKHLSNAYHEKVKMIYIDPPYNTGSDGFVYQDDRKFDVKEFSRLAWVDEEKSKKILDFVDSKSNSHSAWLTFMYPRLYIAKQLLRDDWVIFVSIDDNEVSQLKILMDEIFWEENFCWELIWETATDNNKSKISVEHEYILCYSKNINKQDSWEIKSTKSDFIINKYNELKSETNDIDIIQKKLKNWINSLKKSNEIDLSWVSHYSYVDEKWVYYPWNSNNTKKWDYNYDIIHPLTNKSCNKPSNGWRWPESTFWEADKRWDVQWWKDENTIPKIKKRIETATELLKSYYYEDNRISTNYLKSLFWEKVFDNPKSINLLVKFIRFTISNNDLILDFFWGSWTTWDAVMQLNSEDWGNRKYIMVQLPEDIDKKKNKVAYDFVKDELWIENPTIFEITKERLVRAGNKIKEEKKNDEKIKNIDFWFKVFETSPIWEDYNVESEEFSENLKLFDETKLNEEDIQTLLTTWKTADNISLTQDLQEIILDWYNSYYFEDKLYLMNKDFKTKNLKALLEKIDTDKTFEPKTIIAFGYHFESKNLREIAENIKAYSNKKNIDIDFITRY